MAFGKCPECGDSNYYESYSHRTFDCGFEGHYDIRKKRCGAAKPKRAARTANAEPTNDPASRYRLALLDAAQVAEVIAADMTAADQSPEFPERCKELARQLRAFAGHSPASADFDDLAQKQTAPQTGLLAIMRKIRIR